MKIDPRNTVSPISLSIKSVEKKEPVKPTADFLSKKLDETVAQIASAGLTADEIHSELDPEKTLGFLRSLDVQGKRPRLSNEDLVHLAQKVSDDSLKNPDQAAAAFSSFDTDRVSELLS